MKLAEAATEIALPSSFRDPGGFMFRRDGILYRQINRSGWEAYERLMASGLYGDLTSAGLLISHEDADVALATGSGIRVIRPVEVPFISYPYEWSFSQLKDAALTTLEIQRRALARGMWLKDASAYNIQFLQGRPVLIDTLSLEPRPEGSPWIAYRQFCQHFLAPLALMSRRDIRLGQLSRLWMDGIPLDLASRLLPRQTWLSLSLGLHIHAHARTQVRYSERSLNATAVNGRFSLRSFEALIDSLTSAIRGLCWRVGRTEWADYYETNNNYTDDAMWAKERLFLEMVDAVRPGTAWDVGANTGRFSRLTSARGILTVAWDIDPSCVEANYQDARSRRDGKLLPLMLDLTNPSPAIGWGNEERSSLSQRGPADLVAALGLIHHLAISNNVPLPSIARYLAGLARALIIEFVPKSDSQVRKLLATRTDIFDDYDETGFRRAFESHFVVQRVGAVAGSERKLYLMAGR